MDENDKLRAGLLSPDPADDCEPMTDAQVIPIDIHRRAAAYVQSMPASVSGQHGHDALWAVARKLVADFRLPVDQAEQIILQEFNPRCQPPWKPSEIRHKLQSATKAKVSAPVTDRPLATGAVPQHQPQSQEAPPWAHNLRYSQKTGKLTSDVGNLSLILANDPEWAGCLAYDEFADRIRWQRQPPKLDGLPCPSIGDELADHHVTYVQHWFAKWQQVSYGKQSAWDGIITSAHRNTIHPLRDYLSSLRWDGQHRLDTWLPVYFGAADTEYHRAVGRWWLIAAVTRAYRPGSKVDNMIILEGAQGGGKSSGIEALSAGYYLGRMPDLRDYERAAGALQGNWIVEIGELDAIKGVSATRIKDFLSQCSDHYRAPYAKAYVDRPRGCVFVGTTNDESYLQDPTGARRFWPVATGKIDRAAITRDRDQLWAEAVIRHHANEQWWPDHSLARMIAPEQESRHEVDEWEDVVAEYVQRLRQQGEPHVTTRRIAVERLNIDLAKLDQVVQRRLAAILRRLGLERGYAWVDGRSQRVFKWG